jgi:hypothetical protein
MDKVETDSESRQAASASFSPQACVFAARVWLHSPDIQGHFDVLLQGLCFFIMKHVCQRLGIRLALLFCVRGHRLQSAIGFQLTAIQL